MVGVIDLAAVWNRTRDSAEVPRPSVFERLLRAAGLPVVAAAAYATLGALIVRRSGKRLRLDLGGKRQCGALAEHDPAEDLDLEQRRASIRSKGGDTEFVYWDTGTAHLLPRLLRLPDGTSRTSGPLFLASRRPVPARRPAPRDICPHTGRARLG